MRFASRARQNLLIFGSKFVRCSVFLTAPSAKPVEVRTAFNINPFMDGAKIQTEASSKRRFPKRSLYSACPGPKSISSTPVLIKSSTIFVRR